MTRSILILPDKEAMTAKAVEMILERARTALEKRGRFILALSGGSSVQPVFEALSAASLDWTRIFFFWGDDRFVERDNPYSNYRLAEEALFSRLPQLPRQNIFPVPIEESTPVLGARRYVETIRQFFGLGPADLPRFDLALNGMGPDGHTASLFPHHPAAPDPIVQMRHAGLHPWVDRVTLTFEVFNQARCVLFLASGAAKARTLKNVLEDPPDREQWPSSGIQPPNGEVIWLLDPEIASLLSKDTAGTTS